MRASALSVTLFLVFGTISSGQQQLFPSSAQLDRIALAEAIALGEKQVPGPYLLRQPTSHRFDVAVYTPFVRVALAAHVAKQQRKSIQVTDLPQWLTNPEVHAVIRWPCEEPRRGTFCTTTFAPGVVPEQIGVGLTQIGRPKFSGNVRPLWITTDLSYLEAIGGPPFPDAAIAAGFSADLLRPGMELYGWWRKGNDTLLSLGHIETSDFDKWR